MKKRERENPCGVCGHYHKVEEGEVCGVCGHRATLLPDRPVSQASAFPSEILKGFLYLGSYDNASMSEILKALGISRILNTVPTSQNLYKNFFTYHCLQDDKVVQFDEAIQFLEQCQKEGTRVLVHCMWGKNRSAAVVVAYLMKCKGWRLTQSYQWVKDRRSIIKLSSAVHQQLINYELKIFGSHDAESLPIDLPLAELSALGFGSSPINNSQLPTFDNPPKTSVFDHKSTSPCPNDFVFRSGRNAEQNIMDNTSARG